MAIYSYLIEHDWGLAPNPFGKYCTLAVCKPKIRKSKKLLLGDWVIGTGSKALEDSTGKKLTDKLIYAMIVQEKLTLDEYWADVRFQYKKPIMNAPLAIMFGDNFYHRNENNEWVQEDSAHSHQNGACDAKHLKKDTSGENVLISEHFYYFGSNAVPVPNHLKSVFHTTQGEKKIVGQVADDFIGWLSTSHQTGYKGDPLNWSVYDQLTLF